MDMGAAIALRVSSGILGRHMPGFYYEFKRAIAARRRLGYRGMGAEARGPFR